VQRDLVSGDICIIVYEALYPMSFQNSSMPAILFHVYVPHPYKLNVIMRNLSCTYVEPVRVYSKHCSAFGENRHCQRVNVNLYLLLTVLPLCCDAAAQSLYRYAYFLTCHDYYYLDRNTVI